MAEIAEELGRSADAAELRSVSDKCRSAYSNEFGKDLDTDRQAHGFSCLKWDFTYPEGPVPYSFLKAL